MSKPAIIAVDDDPQVISAVARDLRARYAADYRIISAESGAEALDVLGSLRERGDTVALFLVDQRMPVMSGTTFLVDAKDAFPRAKRVLLTAYADTEAAIQAINEVELDYYLLKPWDPPDANLYPVLDEMLADWRANVPAPFDGIRILGTTYSPRSHELKDFLARNQIPYRFLDVERDEEAATLAASSDISRLPIVVMPGGDKLVSPDKQALAAAVGLQTTAEQPFYDLVIIGGGPAGLAAAVYGASEGLRTMMIEREAPGGQAGTSSRIENYLGFPSGISGTDLARRAATQAKRLGAEILTAVEATKVELDDNVKVISLGDGTQLRSHALLIATGMAVRKLNVPGYERFSGAGVYYGAAISEAATYEGGQVFVIGGANSAGQAAMMFSRYAAKVTMVVRGDALETRMSQYLVDQINGTDNIDVLLNTQVVEVTGDERVEQMVLRDTAADVQHEHPASAVFIFVGAVPHSTLVADLVNTNDRGFIFTGSDSFTGGKPDSWNVERAPFLLETSVPGIFAAGDVREGTVKRVASAVGQGSVSVSLVHRYLETV